jgi:hypothetical protein
MLRVKLINYLILPKSMSMIRDESFDSNTQLTSLLDISVKSCFSEIDEQNRDASFTYSQIQSHDFMIMASKNYLQIGRKCEMCSCIMLAEKATKHRNQRYDIYWKCKNCGFQVRELERAI